jgi:hypothetical protein
MPIHRLLLAPLALAIITLVGFGCREPAGLPNRDVHTATVDSFYFSVVNNGSMSGHVDKYQTALRTWYVRVNSVIRRGYTQVGVYPYPKQHGFCVFSVPSFTSPGMAPLCTLFYYQRAHNGSDVDLEFVLSSIPAWPGSDVDLWSSIENSTNILAIHAAQTTDGWHSVYIDTVWNNFIDSIGENGGGTFVAGWRYTGSISSGDYAEVDGATNDNPPKIKVVYDKP